MQICNHLVVNECSDVRIRCDKTIVVEINTSSETGEDALHRPDKIGFTAAVRIR